YTYAESNPLRLYDDDGREPKDVASRVSSRFSLGQIYVAWLEAKRHSRLWQSLARLALTKRSDKMMAFNERFEIRPLIEINLTPPDDGHQLESIKAGSLRWGVTLKERPAASTAATPPRPSKPAPAKPTGANSAAVDNSGASLPLPVGGLPPLPAIPNPQRA